MASVKVALVWCYPTPGELLVKGDPGSRWKEVMHQNWTGPSRAGNQHTSPVPKKVHVSALIGAPMGPQKGWAASEGRDRKVWQQRDASQGGLFAKENRKKTLGCREGLWD